MASFEQDILNNINKNSFFTFLENYHSLEKEEIDKLVIALSTLHNSKSIDLIEKVTNFDKNTIENYRLYFIESLLNQLLPLINEEPDKIILCVTNAKNNQLELNEGFLNFCKKSSDRANRALSLILEKPNEHIDLIALSIISLDTDSFTQRISELLTFLQSQDKETEAKERIIFALSRIDYLDKTQHIETILDSIRLIIDNSELTILFSTCIRTLVTLNYYSPNLEQNVIALLQKIWRDSELSINLSTVQLLFYEYDKITSSLLIVLINKLKVLETFDPKIIDTLDFGINNLLKHNQQQLAFELIEALLIQKIHNVSLNEFDSTLYTITQSESLSNYLVTKWFMSNSLKLQSSVRDLIQHHSYNKMLSIENNLVLTQDNYTLLSKKACGWLLDISPESTISFILSTLEQVKDKKEKNHICSLLFRFLLLNYSGKTNDFLNQHKKKYSKSLQKLIKQLQKQYEEFIANNFIKESIPELYAPISHRRIFGQHQQKQFQESFKLAREKSIIGQIAKSIMLLYGNSSIYEVHDSQIPNNRTIQESPLIPFSYSQEYPMLDILDKHHLTYELFRFKLEGLI